MKQPKNIVVLIMLWPFAVLYRFITALRNFMYDNNILPSVEFDIPVISIGNISVGGTGKTPHTEFIIGMLREKYRIAVLSRGYKRKTSGYVEVSETSSYLQVGDEPLQMKRKYPETVVAVCEKRVKGIKILMEKYPDLNLIVLDDAFQHRRVRPGLSVLLNNFYHPLSSDHLLPYGRLRESPSGVLRAHVIIVTKCPENMKAIERRIMLKEMDPQPYQYLFFTRFGYHPPRTVFSTPIELDITDLKKYHVLAVSGIAFAKDFIDYLNSTFASVDHVEFADHHDFRKRDIEKIEARFNAIAGYKLIVTTEKDSIRLLECGFMPDALKRYFFYIPISVILQGSEEDKKQFDNQFFTYVSNNKRYSSLYKGTNLR